jgi:hypothetical protein
LCPKNLTKLVKYGVMKAGLVPFLPYFEAKIVLPWSLKPRGDSDESTI